MTTTRDSTLDALDEQVASAGQDAIARSRPGRASWWVIAAVTVVLAVPLMVTLAVLHSPRWYPLLDLAQTEMRVRDVLSSHPPLIGLPGRIGTLAHQGSHPGPISFYALWPFYRLFGANAWALQAASASLHLVAAVIALWIARRRGGTPLVLAVGAALAVLQASYGGAILTEAWNPYMPLSWWFVFLLAVWSVACDDVAMLPIAVLAGSFCMQTHLPYLGLAGGLIGAAFLVVAITAWFRRRDVGVRARAIRWGVIALAVGVVLWLPPVVEQFTHSPGNLQVVVKDLSHPNGATAGVHRGLDLLLLHLDPWALVTNRRNGPASRPVTGSIVPGAVFFALWAIAAFATWRARQRAWLRLHAVLAAALVLAAVSMIRIAGTIWYYLVLWAWGITVLMGVAIVGSAVAILGPRISSTDRPRAARVGMAALAALVVVSSAFFVDEAAYTKVPNVPVTRSVGAVARPTLAYLSRTDPNRKQRYLVSWDDQMTFGARGYSLLLEIERHHYDAGGTFRNSVGLRPHRVVLAANATAEVHLVSGGSLATWARRPGVRRVAFYDPRSAAQRAEFARLQRDVETQLRDAGLTGAVAAVAQGNLLSVAYQATTPNRARSQLIRMLTLGLPLAVFVGPPSGR